MQNQVQYVLRTVEERGVRFVQLWFTDVLGRHKAFHVTPAELEDALDDGMTFDGSAIDGFSRSRESDVLARPDLTTFQLLPWHESGEGVARVFCDIVNTDGSVFEGCPRQQLRRVLGDAHDKGYTFYVAPELEYFYFSDIEGARGPVPVDNGSYFDLLPDNAGSVLRRQTVLTLEEMGIGVEHAQHEDAPGQYEIDLRYTDALTMADHVMTARHVIKELARQAGLVASFMPKPIFGDNGSGMHVHQSIWKGGKPVMAGNKYADLSQECLWYIGGIIKHAKALNAFTNPSTNSYKRLVPGYEAPVLLAYSARNRSASCRIPWTNNPKAKRVEVRFPDPTANPYLAFAAMLMAGLDGIQNKIDPGAAMDKDLYDLPPKELKKIPTVCGSLREALQNLDKDRAFLKAGGVFNDDFIDSYIELKMTEVIRFEHTPHPVEYEMYYSA